MIEAGTLEAHFICRGSTGVYRAGESFVSGSWSVPLHKARKIGRICLHEHKNAEAYLSGRVERVWTCPDSGRVIFLAHVDDGASTLVDGWSFVSRFRPLNRPAMTPERERLVRAVVRMGYIVAGADGLDEAEIAELEQYAVERSDLSLAAAQEERRNAAMGVNALQDADIDLLRALDAETWGAVVADIREVASAGGDLSDAELSALRHIVVRVRGGKEQN
jgi:uncharacterized tellurite resistance protein B-like protein